MTKKHIVTLPLEAMVVEWLDNHYDLNIFWERIKVQEDIRGDKLLVLFHDDDVSGGYSKLKRLLEECGDQYE